MDNSKQHRERESPYNDMGTHGAAFIYINLYQFCSQSRLPILGLQNFV